jgi:thiamine pyrophosphokinase
VKRAGKCLIVCNGDINQKLLSKILKSDRKTTLIAADGASNILKQLKIIPHYIVGDLDSIKKSVLNYYRNKGVKIKNISEQKHTDLEKSIRLALSLKLRRIDVIGYGGKRIDHTINNFSVLKRYYRKADIRFLDIEFEIFYTNKSVAFKYRKGDTISILGMPEAKGVKTHGLLYPLRNEPLEFGVREGILNEAAMNTVKIEMEKGELLIFKKHYLD